MTSALISIAARAPRALLLDHPGGDPLEAWPPQRHDLGPVAEILEQLASEIEQTSLGIGGQLVGIGAHEALERTVDHGAALERPGVGLERLERAESEDPPWRRDRKGPSSTARCR